MKSEAIDTAFSERIERERLSEARRKPYQIAEATFEARQGKVNKAKNKNIITKNKLS